MLNSFSGLEMGKRALNAFRQGIETAGHNITNVYTEGYSRQRVNLSTTDPFAAPGLSSPAVAGQIGTGVKIDEIVRIRDEFLDFQYRSELSTLGYWNKINELYKTVQLYISEPQGDGVRAGFDTFWASLQELQKNPESSALREAVVQSAKSLGAMIDTVIEGYDQYASMVNSEVKSLVDQANATLHQIAALNKQISQIEALGQHPNDLLDKRDLLLDKLTEMLDVDIQEPFESGDITGEFFITLNGRTLVQGDRVRELVAHAFEWEGRTYYDVQVADNEFDIVENPSVALVLATGPEGVHMLKVDRLANGEEWTVGGEDPLCLDPDGTLHEPQERMRARPMTTTEALGLSGAFRIQVGSQGVLVPSRTFDNTGNPDLKPGDILGEGKKDGESYTFRVGANDYQVDITATWETDPADPTKGHWELKSDTGKSASSQNTHLTAEDLAGFLAAVLPSSGDDAFVVKTGTDSGNNIVQFSIASKENYLISISDVSGDLAQQMNMVNPNPVITIDVGMEDSLETIRNKINEKYQEAYGLTHPEQWVHAALAQDTDQSWYLTIASDVAGEAQRITLMGDENGSLQTLRRLGLVGLDQIGTNTSGEPIYREVTAYSKIAEDASFTFDGARYLSADNKFDKARRVPAGTNRSDYSATALSTVSEGMWIELRSTGQTAITVRHHVRNGSIKALEEIRDGLIPGLKAELDDVAWALINNFNAYHYAGYGIGDNLGTTGTAFFDPLSFKSGSAGLLQVSDAVADDVSLIGAGMGKLDENGRAVYGQSSGGGSGVNAARMAALKEAKLLNSNSASVGDFYEAYLAKIGSEAGRASLMYEAQKNLTEQIDAQRQSVMGVNIDEEMLDILKFNQAFNAISRYVTTIDEMLDRIINGFGLVGR
jgi:flagellar hook-associated protein 1 FlgK